MLLLRLKNVCPLRNVCYVIRQGADNVVCSYYFDILDQKRSSRDPSITLKEDGLYTSTDPLHTVSTRRRPAYLMNLGSKISMTAQNWHRRQVETDLPMVSLNLSPHVFDQYHGPVSWSQALCYLSMVGTCLCVLPSAYRSGSISGSTTKLVYGAL